MAAAAGRRRGGVWAGEAERAREGPRCALRSCCCAYPPHTPAPCTCAAGRGEMSSQRTSWPPPHTGSLRPQPGATDIMLTAAVPGRAGAPITTGSRPDCPLLWVQGRCGSSWARWRWCQRRPRQSPREAVGHRFAFISGGSLGPGRCGLSSPPSLSRCEPLCGCAFTPRHPQLTSRSRLRSAF